MNELFPGLAQEIVSGVALGCIYALIALGFTLIFKATEVVNFAQGELMMVGAYVNFFFITIFLDSLGFGNWPSFILALIASIGFSVLFGVFLDFAINKPLKDEPVFSMIMATISVAIILRAVVALIAGPITLVPPSPFGNSVIRLGSVAISTLDLFIILSAVILVSIFYIIFNKTRWGLAMQATAEDPMAAGLMGIPVKKVYRNVWIFATIVATIGGVLLAPRTLLDTNMGFLGLKAFPAAVLGGFGSIPGAIVGGVILGVVETISMGTLSFHFHWIKEINDVIVWIVLILVLMIRPVGILGKEEVERV
ncbi:MAG: branched-chain amino acid ABC transporter permease [Candidatus Marinimicrobia bacterium]|jgi:branched-chain amino acid transport system permease protein|nr:branched-chain amino acid ABC transporter permease [Candidatus Neomarinimicrobiota bacterium]MDP6789338.1 branched-chain amino acid ABC transporter permease [Candidatus Neomarinimicrobiota bacterium]MDP7071752.1 branched-chain amino acid ABC transporter permease [Candidatus Neomarinimicrobiota bacterium]